MTEAGDLIGLAPSLARIGVNAVAGYPEMLAFFARTVLGNRLGLRPRLVIWTGGNLTSGCAALLRELNPELEFWSVYSSSEAGGVAFGFPDCALGVHHLWPGQILELTAERCCLTRAVGLPAGRPLLRLPLGDRIEGPVTCPCARDLPALRVQGRLNDMVRLYDAVFSVDSLRLAATDSPEVIGAQVILVPEDLDDPYGPQRSLGVRVDPRTAVAGRGVADRTRARMTTQHAALRAISERSPEAFWIECGPLEQLSDCLKTKPAVVSRGHAPDLWSGKGH
ncbi:hypothetical protein AV521_02695 [Streptomyces sp. IMTB 2501]|nr:hypothetical protein AV521_02695 [Streptomyces sp. IMTB 2501]